MRRRGPICWTPTPSRRWKSCGRQTFFPPADAGVLIEAARLQQALTQVLRIALDETPNVEDATPGLKALLTRAAEVGSFAQTQLKLACLQTQTRDIFNRLLQAQ